MIDKNNIKRNFLGFLFLIGITTTVYAQATACHGQIFNPISQICWKCVFPITIGSSPVASGDLPDTSNPSNPVCECGSFPDINIGASMGYWEPMGLVDITRTPYCMVNLGGKQLSSNPTREGDVATTSSDQNNSFYYVHFYNYPIIKYMFPGLLGGACNTDGEPMVYYMSELDPSWNDDKANFALFPETMIYLNPLTTLAAHGLCALDTATDNTGLPSDSSYWCAGSQGFMYPMSGNVAEHVSTSQATTLIAERVVFKLHRIGMILDSSSSHLCGEIPQPIMPKSRYRYQMAYPKVNACEPFGRSTALWDSNTYVPTQGDDSSYVIWRKRNCCNY